MGNENKETSALESLINSLRQDNAQDTTAQGQDTMAQGQDVETDNAGEETQEQERTFTQKDVNRMMTKEKREGKESVYKMLGLNPRDPQSKNVLELLGNLIKSGAIAGQQPQQLNNQMTQNAQNAPLNQQQQQNPYIPYQNNQNQFYGANMNVVNNADNERVFTAELKAFVLENDVDKKYADRVIRLLKADGATDIDTAKEMLEDIKEDFPKYFKGAEEKEQSTTPQQRPNGLANGLIGTGGFFQQSPQEVNKAQVSIGAELAKQKNAINTFHNNNNNNGGNNNGGNKGFFQI